jgi:putative integral membrane protein (TIGR02587 family)
VSRDERGPWRRELDDFLRAFCGAFLFGMPLLFTMEMWWLGTLIRPWELLVLLAIAFVANLGLARFGGFKRQEARDFADYAEQSVDAVAVGAIASATVLLVLNRIAFGDPMDTILGKIVVQTVPLSIGASVANLVFAPGKSREGDDQGRPGIGGWRAVLRDLGATAAGAIFVGSSIAPTEEVFMLAAQLTYLHLLALVGFSILLTYAIVFESGFHVGSRGPRVDGLARTPETETALAYLVSLSVAGVVLFLLNRAELGDPLAHLVSQTFVLGLPAAIGGAAGRLVV